MKFLIAAMFIAPIEMRKAIAKGLLHTFPAMLRPEQKTYGMKEDEA